MVPIRSDKHCSAVYGLGCGYWRGCLSSCVVMVEDSWGALLSLIVRRQIIRHRVLNSRNESLCWSTNLQSTHPQCTYKAHVCSSFSLRRISFIIYSSVVLRGLKWDWSPAVHGISVVEPGTEHRFLEPQPRALTKRHALSVCLSRSQGSHTK